MTGLIGFSSGYYTMLDCDVLLMTSQSFLRPQDNKSPQSFPEPVPSIVDRLLQTSELVLQGGVRSKWDSSVR
jgi:hypothetical protein